MLQNRTARIPDLRTGFVLVITGLLSGSTSVAGPALWSFGRVSKLNHFKVDIQLCGKEPWAKLHRVHFFLRLHPESGVWMTSVTDHCSDLQSKTPDVKEPLTSKACAHQSVKHNNQVLERSEERCLSEASYDLRIGKLSYQIMYRIEDVKAYITSFTCRNEFIRFITSTSRTGNDAPRPLSALAGISFRYDMHNDLAGWHDPYRSGAFGIVYLGFDPATGGLPAIKGWNCKTDAQIKAMLHAIYVGVRVALNNRNCEGVIATFDWRNAMSQETIHLSPIDHGIETSHQGSPMAFRIEAESPNLEGVKNPVSSDITLSAGNSFSWLDASKHHRSQPNCYPSHTRYLGHWVKASGL